MGRVMLVTMIVDPSGESPVILSGPGATGPAVSAVAGTASAGAETVFAAAGTASADAGTVSADAGTASAVAGTVSPRPYPVRGE